MSGFFVQRLLQFNFALGTGNFGGGTPNKFSVTAASAISGSGSLAASGSISGGGSLAASGSVSGSSSSSGSTQSVGTPAAPQNAAQNATAYGQPLRALVHVEFATLPSTGTAQIRIWGLSLDHMNLLSSTGLVQAARKNTVTILAGDTVNGMATVFTGTIFMAWPDIDQPESPFYIVALPTAIQQLQPVAPLSFTGPVPAAQALGAAAGAAGWTLENNGVNGTLQTPYWAGTAWQQVLKVCTALDCFATVDGVNNVLAAWPKTGSRAGQPTVISPETGMIGYPKFQYALLTVRQLFFPGFAPRVGKQVTVKSQLQSASGTFKLTGINLDLSCNLPKGPWEAVMTMVQPKQQ